MVSTTLAAEPATVEAAAAVLDLRKFPVIAGSKVESMRSLGMLMYEAPSASQAAYEFQRQQLVKAGWKEAPGGHHSPGNDVGQFSKQGFVLMVSASDILQDPQRAGWSHVALVNSGNVPADKLPVPPGAKPSGFFHGQAMFLTDASVADTAADARKLMLAAGWIPYGAAGGDDAPMHYFKKNGIRVLAWTSLAPAQGNKTMLRYSTELLSADLPLFPDADDPRYDDFEQSLRFSHSGDDAGPIVKYYQDALGKLGWKPMTEEPITDEGKGSRLQVFRNAANDLISVNLEQYNDHIDARVEFDTAAEVAAEDQRAKLAAAQAARARQEEARAASIAKTQSPPVDEDAVPAIPATDDLNGLLEAAEKLSGEDLGEVRKALESMPGKKPAGPGKGASTAGKGSSNKAPAGKPAGEYRVPRIADLPMPEGAGVEYERVTRMITVTSADDVQTLANFFVDRLGELGWKPSQKPLITDTSAIIKLGQGNATLTIMGRAANGGSEATLLSKGMAWDSIPESKIATRKPESPPADAPDADAAPMESETPAPAKLRYAAQISPAEQKQTGATLRTGEGTHQLAYGIAFQALDGEEMKTEILLSTKPINVAKVVALLNNGQDGADALGFDPCLRLRFDAENKLSYLFMYADGLSVNLGGQGDDKVQSSLAIVDDRAQGKAHLVEPGKLFEKEYSFTAPFDVKLITGTPGGAAPQPGATDELGAEDYSGLPVPLVSQSRSSVGSQFRKTVEVEVPASLSALVAFYRRELPSRGWKEDPAAAKISDDAAALAFAGPEGPLTVKLTKTAEGTRATIAARFPAKAQATGITPQPGKGRLILGNAGEREAVIVINGQQYKVAAGKGAENPKDGISLHVQPGNYTVSVKGAGEDQPSEKLKISAGETWGVIVSPVGGYLADQLY
ncbi:MAG: hypothetical protein JNG90_04395 [Planctomycetaceae bacterium]|nr:hypothetical protein [Planctomycetaceae bacterium]